MYGGCSEAFSGSRLRMRKAFVRIWDTESGQELSTLPAPEGVYSVSTFSENGRWFVGTRMPSAAAQIFRPQTGITNLSVVETESGKKIADIRGSVAIGISATHHRVIAMGAIGVPRSGTPTGDEGIRLWNTDNGKDTPLALARLSSGGISADGSRLLLVGTGLNVVDLETGESQTVDAGKLPWILGSAISPDHDHIALAQAGDVLLLSISNPSDRRIIGNSSAEMISSQVFESAASQESSYDSLSRKEQRKIQQDYGKKMSKAKKPEDQQRIWAELKRVTNGDPEAKKAAEKQAETEMLKALRKFGAPCGNSGPVAFLASGRMLALGACDLFWDVWDVGTGNRLPFRKTFDTESFRSSNGHIDVEGSIRELETDLTGKAAAAKPSPPGASGTSVQVACSSNDGRYRIEFVRNGDRLKSATLIRPGNASPIDLLATGIDLSAWAAKPIGREFSRHTYLCSLNADGTRMIAEKPKPQTPMGKLSKYQEAMRQERERQNEAFGKTTVDSLLMYDPGTGREVCELERKVNKKPSYMSYLSDDIFPDELAFSPDGALVLGGGELANKARPNKPLFSAWDAATCKQLPQIVGEAERFLGFSSDGKQYFTAMAASTLGTANFGVRVWDAKTAPITQPLPPRPLYELPDASEKPKSFTSMAGGNVLIGPDVSQAISFWDSRTGEKLGSLRAFQEGEWLVTTPSGLFDGSPRGWTTIAWRGNSGDLVTQSGEIFFNEFYRPGLLAELLEGRSPAAPRTISQVDRRQPKVVITSASQTTSARTVTLQISVEEVPPTASEPRSSGARDLRVFRNGSLVKSWRGDLRMNQGRATFEVAVAVPSGETRFTAYVFNKDNVKSQDAVLTVQSSAPRRPGTAYVLAVGVNRYANAEFNLNFAVPDAKRLTEMLARTQQEVGSYGNVVAVNLLDELATRSNIMLALARLGGQQRGALPQGAAAVLGTLQAVEPEDTVVVFFAGHGTAYGGRFYLIPHDLGYKGSRDNLRNSIQTVIGSSISDQDLEQAFELVDAGSVMLIIDACNSGKALDAEDARRGPLNNRGLAQLAYEKGMFVLTASQAYQAALESSKLGHGYLTYALAEEGLTSPDADVKPTDGRITAVEWFEFATRRVPQLQMEALQEAAANKRLLVFDPAVLYQASPSQTQPDLSGGRLQTPRLYYRRDDAAPAPVVSKR